MDRWKSRGGKSQRREDKKREDQRRERVTQERRCRCEKVGKSRNTVFFQWFVAPEGRKVGSLKRRVRSQLARWEMKNCTPLCRKAHKAPHVRTNFWKLKCRFAWQVQGNCASCQKRANREGFVAFPKRWHAWDIWRGSRKMHFARQALYKRHVHQRC